MSKSHKSANSPNREPNEELESGSKKILNKKTKRDNSSNSSLQESLSIIRDLSKEIRCSVCLEFEKFSYTCYKCKTCSAYFHLDCYNFFAIHGEEETEKLELKDVENFVCPRCKEEEKTNTKITCHLCREHEGIMKKRKDNKDNKYKFLHHYCYVYFKDILDQTKNGKCKNCKITNLPCIKCKTTGCKDKYHIDCALEKGIIFSLSFLRNEQNENKKDSFNELLQFFCEVHNQDFIINYAQYIQAMNQSLDEKKKQSQIGDNNPINILIASRIVIIMPIMKQMF